MKNSTCSLSRDLEAVEDRHLKKCGSHIYLRTLDASETYDLNEMSHALSDIVGSAPVVAGTVAGRGRSPGVGSAPVVPGRLARQTGRAGWPGRLIWRA